MQLASKITFRCASKAILDCLITVDPSNDSCRSYHWPEYQKIHFSPFWITAPQKFEQIKQLLFQPNTFRSMLTFQVCMQQHTTDGHWSVLRSWGMHVKIDVNWLVYKGVDYSIDAKKEVSILDQTILPPSGKVKSCPFHEGDSWRDPTPKGYLLSKGTL